MKSLRLILLGALLFPLVVPMAAHAQAYGARRMTRRLPQAPPQPAASVNTNAPAPPQPTPAVTAPIPVVRTQAVVRIVQPPVDPEKARLAKEEAVRKTVEFQKKRAEEGSESAQYELGVRYLKGEGVEKDEATGRKWLTMSAQNGYAPATRKLEDLNKPPAPASATPAADKATK
jgi:hypothetical protein